MDLKNSVGVDYRLACRDCLQTNLDVHGFYYPGELVGLIVDYVSPDFRDYIEVGDVLEYRLPVVGRGIIDGPKHCPFCANPTRYELAQLRSIDESASFVSICDRCSGHEFRWIPVRVQEVAECDDRFQKRFRLQPWSWHWKFYKRQFPYFYCLTETRIDLLAQPGTHLRPHTFSANNIKTFWE